MRRARYSCMTAIPATAVIVPRTAAGVSRSPRKIMPSGIANIGAVMGRVVPQFKGRAEGGTINAIAREELGKQG